MKYCFPDDSETENWSGNDDPEFQFKGQKGIVLDSECGGPKCPCDIF